MCVSTANITPTVKRGRGRPRKDSMNPGNPNATGNLEEGKK